MIRSIYFLFILFGCSSNQQGIVEISAERLMELKKEGVAVIDLRTKNEYDQGHIPGVERIDFLADDFMEQMSKQSISEPLVIHCASGGRSGKAAKMLLEVGFEKIYDYSGGFSDWKSKGLEIE